MHKLLLIALLFSSTFSLKNVTASGYSCSVDSKVDCGWNGIDEAKCEERGCCWEPSNIKGEPWCHKPEEPTTGICAVAVEKRIDCAYRGIMENECINTKHCCWYPLSENSAEPWCYYSTESPQCEVIDDNKIPCLKSNATQEECEASGCCWQVIKGINQSSSKCYQSKPDGINYIESCDANNSYEKKDCGEMGISQTACEERGCCYEPSEEPNVPWCFYKVTKKVEPKQESEEPEVPEMTAEPEIPADPSPEVEKVAFSEIINSAIQKE